MKDEKDQATTTAIVPSANIEGVSREALEEAERHLDAIARAIGRHMAREHIKAIINLANAPWLPYIDFRELRAP